MERLKELGRYQQVLLILLAAMILLFAVLYAVTTSRVGFSYWDEILVWKEEKGINTYSGKIHGQSATFTVYADKSVEFCYGEQVYGPYIVKEDATAIPKDHQLSSQMIGIEITDPEGVYFRGGVVQNTRVPIVVGEDGKNVTQVILISSNQSGFRLGAPSVLTILDMVAGPQLSHKGQWAIWWLCTFFCGVTAVSILFADELFYLKLCWKVRDPELAEPSEWELTGRYIGWTIMVIVIVVGYIAGIK